MADEAWHVKDVKDTQVFEPGQGAVPGKTIVFETYTGHISHVDIPDSEFSPDTVAAVINDAASKIMQVAALTGPPVMPQIPAFDPGITGYQ